MMQSRSAEISELVDANHILAAHGVLDAFGHVSARSADESTTFLLARNLAPGLVREDDIQEFDLDGTTQDSRPPYLERFIHAEIYRARPDVMAVVHSHRESLGIGSDLLIRNKETGADLARVLGTGSVALMRGHGSVAVGDSLKIAVYRAVYTEINAKTQSDAMRLGPYTCLTAEEGVATVATMASQIERAWGVWRANARAIARGET